MFAYRYQSEGKGEVNSKNKVPWLLEKKKCWQDKKKAGGNVKVNVENHEPGVTLEDAPGYSGTPRCENDLLPGWRTRRGRVR